MSRAGAQAPGYARLAMKSRLLALAATVLCALVAVSLGAGSGRSETYGFKASLDARQEVPPQRVKVPAATGTFAGTLTLGAARSRIAWTLTFSRLSGRAVQADIRLGALGRSGPIAVRLCRICRSAMHGTATVTASTVSAIRGGRAYVNVATSKNPKGEIRGQIRLIQGG
jgi:CHRD domain-containing protein